MTLTMRLTAAVTVSVPITHPWLLAVAVLLQAQNCSLLLGPVFETKAATSKSGNGVGRGQFDMCRVNADVFPGSLNSNTDIIIAMIVADAVKLTQSELSDSQSVNRTTLFSLSQTNYHSNHRKMTVKCVTTIPCIDPADVSLSINISD